MKQKKINLFKLLFPKEWVIFAMSVISVIVGFLGFPYFILGMWGIFWLTIIMERI